MPRSIECEKLWGIRQKIHDLSRQFLGRATALLRQSTEAMGAPQLLAWEPGQNLRERCGHGRSIPSSLRFCLTLSLRWLFWCSLPGLRGGATLAKCRRSRATHSLRRMVREKAPVMRANLPLLSLAMARVCTSWKDL